LLKIFAHGRSEIRIKVEETPGIRIEETSGYKN